MNEILLKTTTTTESSFVIVLGTIFIVEIQSGKNKITATSVHTPFNLTKKKSKYRVFISTTLR